MENYFVWQIVTRDTKRNVTSTVNDYFHVKNTVDKVKIWCMATKYIKPIFLVHLHCVESNTLHRGLKEDTVTLPYGLYWKYHRANTKLRNLVKNQLKSPNKFALYMQKDWFIDEYYKQLIGIMNEEYIYNDIFDIIDEKKYHLLIFSYYYNAYNKTEIIHAIQQTIYDKIDDRITVDGILGDETTDYIKRYVNRYDGFGLLDQLQNNLFEMYKHKRDFNLNKNGWKNRLKNAVELTKIMYGKDR